MHAGSRLGEGLYGCGRLADLEGAPLRPGGLDLTEELIGLAGFHPGDCVADVGCGLGASTRLLPAPRRRGHRNRRRPRDRPSAPRPFVAADAARLPFADHSLDGVLAECVLSVMTDRGAALAEWVRALKPGGRLALSDVYSRAGAPTGPFATRDALLQSVASAGLRVDCFEDRSEALRRWVGGIHFLLRLARGALRRSRWDRPGDARPDPAGLLYHRRTQAGRSSR